MEKRETTKVVELGGRKWQIEKFDALTGCFIAYKLLTQLVGSGVDEQLAAQMPGLPSLPKGRTVMGKAEFMELQRDCLSVVKELKDVGGVPAPVPVLLANGGWGVEGLADNTMLVMTLTIHALVFNVSSFFDAAALKELTGSIAGMSLFNART